MGQAYNSKKELIEFQDPTPEERALAKAKADAAREARLAARQQPPAK